MSGALSGRAGRESAGLEVAAWVEGEFSQELAGVAGGDPDVQVVDEQGDAGAGVLASEADVVQPAVVAQGDGAGLVDAVVPDPAVRLDVGAGGGGLGAGGVGLPGGPPVQGPVRADLVVVAAEPGELALQAGGGLGRWLRGEPLLLGLLEAFDLALGLWVVGS